jgi:YesN/AraC family two-component response regulator
VENFSAKKIQNLSILLVDDEPFIQSAIKQALLNFGFGHIYTAENGEKALDLFNKTDIDILLTDIQMPVMNGLELLKAVRSGYGHVKPTLPVIVFTCMSDIETLGRAIAMDVNGFLTKPIAPETFCASILTALSEEEVELRNKSNYLEIATDSDGLGPVNDQSESIAAEPIESHSDQPASVHALRPGMRLAADVLGSNGDLLLRAGITLNQRMISRLIELDRVMSIDDYYVEPHENPIGRSVNKPV